jgi:hypothetical protein
MEAAMALMISSSGTDSQLKLNMPPSSAVFISLSDLPTPA